MTERWEVVQTKISTGITTVRATTESRREAQSLKDRLNALKNGHTYELRKKVK